MRRKKRKKRKSSRCNWDMSNPGRTAMGLTAVAVGTAIGVSAIRTLNN